MYPPLFSEAPISDQKRRPLNALSQTSTTMRFGIRTSYCTFDRRALGAQVAKDDFGGNDAKIRPE
jgi:hypothetical protein